VVFSNSAGREVAEGRVPASAVGERFDVLEELGDQLATCRARAGVDGFRLSVAKRLSATVLSSRSLVERVERAVPASRAFWPKPSATHCEPGCE
jgi:hypothetical protein